MALKAYAVFDLNDGGQLRRVLPSIRKATQTPGDVSVRLMPYAEALETYSFMRELAEEAEGVAVRYPRGAGQAAIEAAQRKTGFDYAAEIIGNDAPGEIAAILNNAHTLYQPGEIARMAIVREEGGRRVFRD